LTVYFATARLSDLNAKREQLATDARRSPQRNFRVHPPDQRAQFRIEAVGRRAD